MNEELLQELIKLLKEGRDFAPQAFNELLAQYQGYHFTCGVIGLIFGFICAIILAASIRAASKIDWDGPTFSGIVCLGFGFLSIIATPVCLTSGVGSLLKGLYPLASLMGKAL